MYFERKGWPGKLCVSPVQATGCLCCPLMVVDVASGEGLFLKWLYIFSEVLLCHDGSG